MTMRMQLPASKYATPGGAPRVLRAARAAARAPSPAWRRWPSQPACRRSMAANGCWRSTARASLTNAAVRLDRDDQPAILRRCRRAAAARPHISRHRRRARRRDRDHQRAAGVAVFPRRGSDRQAAALHAARTRPGPARARLAHDRRHQPVDSARLATGRLPNAVVYLPYRQESPGAASLLVRSGLPPARSWTPCGARCRRSIVTSRSSPSRRWSSCCGEPLAVSRVRQLVRHLRRDRARAVVGGSLRGDGVLGDAADAGDRRAHGARRPARDRCRG